MNDSNTGIGGVPPASMFVYYKRSNIFTDDPIPWFRVEGLSREYNNRLGESADLILIIDHDCIAAYKNRFNDDIIKQRGNLIIAITKFITQTIDNLAGWHNRCHQVDRDSIYEAVHGLINPETNTGINDASS